MGTVKDTKGNMNEPKQKRRLSELIRAGAALRPQCAGMMFGTALNGEPGSCALGAAYEAITGVCSNFHGTQHISSSVDLLAMCPILNKVVSHPSAPFKGPMGEIIPYLNDTERLTREEIADWVEAIEAEEACRAIPAKPEPVTA